MGQEPLFCLKITIFRLLCLKLLTETLNYCLNYFEIISYHYSLLTAKDLLLAHNTEVEINYNLEPSKVDSNTFECAILNSLWSNISLMIFGYFSSELFKTNIWLYFYVLML